MTEAKSLSGKRLAEKIYRQVRKTISSIAKHGVKPKIVVVLVGRDGASQAYVDMKKKMAEKLGMLFELHTYPSNIPERELCHRVVELNRARATCGIIVQLPLPKHINRQQVLDCVLPNLDIDGLTTANQKKLAAGRRAFTPPTPAGILALLKSNKIALHRKKVIIIGAGDLVGKPLALLLRRQGVEISVATSSTQNLSAATRAADILISAVGKPGLIRSEHVKPGAVVIDAGTAVISRAGARKVMGDVHVPSVKNKAGALTPVPGGVGPVTVAMLYKNAAESAARLFN